MFVKCGVINVGAKSMDADACFAIPFALLDQHLGNLFVVHVYTAWHTL